MTSPVAALSEVVGITLLINGNGDDTELNHML